MRRTVRLERRVDAPAGTVRTVLADVTHWPRWLPVDRFEPLDAADGIHRLRLVTSLTGARPIDLEVLVGRRSVRLHAPGRSGADLEGRWSWRDDAVTLELSIEVPLLRRLLPIGRHRRLRAVAGAWLDALGDAAEQAHQASASTAPSDARSDEALVYRSAGDLVLHYRGRDYRLEPTRGDTA
ncbi:MAG: SRPBCC family protein [Acidobacteriota bacterium]